MSIFTQSGVVRAKRNHLLKQLAEELGERVKGLKIDVDQNPEIASRFQIQSVPTILIFKNGEIKHKQAGVHSKAQLMSILMNI